MREVAAEAPAPSEKPRPALPAPKGPQARLLGIAAVDGRLIAVGQQGLILESTDGRRWEQKVSPVSTMLTRVRFVEGGNGWIVGYDATILSTGDGGRSWALRHFNPTAHRALHDILFLGPQRGIAVGAYGTVLTTGDGGASWQPQDSVVAELGMHLNAIIRLNDGSVLIAGERGLLARSGDEGQTWKLLQSPYAGSWFGALPHGYKGVLVFGMRGNTFATSDVSALPEGKKESFEGFERVSLSDAAIAAAGWRQFPNPIRESLFGGTLTDPQHAVMVGVNGVIVRADLAAGTLEPLEKLKDEPLAGVVKFGEALVVVGRRGAQRLETAQ